MATYRDPETGHFISREEWEALFPKPDFDDFFGLDFEEFDLGDEDSEY
jgi:hypothetical protein